MRADFAVFGIWVMFFFMDTINGKDFWPTVFIDILLAAFSLWLALNIREELRRRIENPRAPQWTEDQL
jgi:hypothetical protein